MHLGYEYHILSEIASEYHRNSDGKYRLKEKDYQKKILDDSSLIYLTRLESVGIASRQKEQIAIDSHTWIKQFIEYLNVLLEPYNFSSEYLPTENIICFNKGQLKVHFETNFSPEKFDPTKNQINFCFTYSYSYSLFWLDLLTDQNQLEFFCAYLNNEITKLQFEDRIVFDIFEGLKDEYLGEIFRVSIPAYFDSSNKRFPTLELSPTVLQLIKKLIKRDFFEYFAVRIDNHDVVFIKNDKRIDILSFQDESLVYSLNVKQEINRLKDKLITKISTYRRYTLMNENKLHDVSRKTIQVFSFLLLPLNLVMLSFSFFQQLANNLVLRIIVVSLLFILLSMIICTLVVPTIKLLFFNWKIKYYD
jgi:hypothetical protein